MKCWEKGENFDHNSNEDRISKNKTCKIFDEGMFENQKKKYFC